MCDCGNSSLGNWGAKVGGQLGDKVEAFGRNTLSGLAKRFKSWTGLGDYKISQNSLIAGSGTAYGPQYSNSGRGLIVRHKEFLGEIAVHPANVGEFRLRKYNINPADVTTFPWFAAIAQNYDQYRPLGVIFEFVSTVSDQTAGGALGSVVMMTEYDVLDADPTSKREMLSTAYSQEAKMSDNATHGVECDPNELQRTVFYTRTYHSEQTEGPRDYDVGTFYIATQGGTLTAGTIVGSLYVHYEFELFKEQPFGGITQKSQIWQTFTYTFPGAVAWPAVSSWEFVAGFDIFTSVNATTLAWPLEGFESTRWRFQIYYQSGGGYGSPAGQFTPAVSNCTLTSKPSALSGFFQPYTSLFMGSPEPGAINTESSYAEFYVDVNSAYAANPLVSFANNAGATAPFPVTPDANATMIVIATLVPNGIFDKA